MRLRTTIPLAAAAAVAAAGVVALGGAEAQPAADRTVLMKLTRGTPVVDGKPLKGGKIATGDGVILQHDLFDADRRAVGQAHLECVNVGRKGPIPTRTMQCHQTYVFDDGQVDAAGVVRFDKVGSVAGLSVPVTGGSGAYRGASGELEFAPPANGFEVVVLRLG